MEVVLLPLLHRPHPRPLFPPLPAVLCPPDGQVLLDLHPVDGAEGLGDSLPKFGEEEVREGGEPDEGGDENEEGVDDAQGEGAGEGLGEEELALQEAGGGVAVARGGVGGCARVGIRGGEGAGHDDAGGGVEGRRGEPPVPDRGGGEAGGC